MPRAALLIALGNGGFQGLPQDNPGASDQMPSADEFFWPLLPLGDRPFLQHVIERIVSCGVRELDVALHHAPEKIEALIDDGARWGLLVRYHLVAEDDPDNLLTFLLRLPDIRRAAQGGGVLIADAGLLPLEVDLSGDAGVSVVAPESGEATGWGIVPADLLDSLTPGISFRDAASATVVLPEISCSELLSARTAFDLLKAQRSYVSGGCPGLLRTGSEVEQGIHLSRNVSLHPSALIVPPIFIGEDCRIGAMARVGPNVVIGNGCFIDVGATVADSLVLGGSYVGEEVEVRDAIVDRNRLVSVFHGTAVVVTDSFLLADLYAPGTKEATRSLFSRIAGAALTFFCWPVILLTALWLRIARKGAFVRWVEIAAPPDSRHLPAGTDTTAYVTFAREGQQTDGLAHLLLDVLPALPDVAAGRVHLVGVKPRSPEEIAALPHDWSVLCQATPPGLITEAWILYGPDANDDETYSAEAYYAVTGGFRRDIGLFFRYLLRAFWPRRRKSSGLTAAKAR